MNVDANLYVLPSMTSGSLYPQQRKWTHVKKKKKKAKYGEFLKWNVESFAFSPDAENCIQCPAQEHPNSERNCCVPKGLTFLGFDDPWGVPGLHSSLGLPSQLRFCGFCEVPRQCIVKVNNWLSAMSCSLPSPVFPLLLLTLHRHPNRVTCILQ